jgi:hypothetical protein
LKPRIKVLVAVWGASYIDAFVRLALPSLLAPGNLPALAEAADLEVCVLTSERDIPLIESKPAIQALRALCPLQFVSIDDLLGSSVYGITLTLAYMRGIATEGENMVNVHYMFFNSDFILAEGSLKSMLRHILAGRRAVMAPSFRAIAEDIELRLKARVDGARHTLAVPPREMVALALRYIHPTVIAKTLNQNAFRSLYQNQLYWRVDKDTVLGRLYLMFMLCIRPERVVKTANTYCDYGFIPELCPSLDFAVLADSDEFFMLETQARHHESAHTRLGSHRVADVAGYLGEWTTREHRMYARENLVFHAADIPADIGAFADEASRAVGKIERLLPAPRAHAFHPYWVGSLPIWTKALKELGASARPPELEPVAEASVKRTLMGTVFGLARDVVRGTPGDLKIWHAGWLDQRALERLIEELRHDARALLVADEAALATKRIAQKDNVERSPLRQSLEMAADAGSRDRYEDILVVLTPQQLGNGSDILPAALLPLVRPGGRLQILVQDPGNEFMPASLSQALMSMLSRTFDAFRVEASVEFADGSFQRRIRLGARRLGQLYLRLGWGWAPVLVLRGIVLMVANVLNHLRWMIKGSTRDQPDYCGYMLVRIRRL